MDVDIWTLFWQGKSAFPIVYQPEGVLACRWSHVSSICLIQ